MRLAIEKRPVPPASRPLTPITTAQMEDHDGYSDEELAAMETAVTETLGSCAISLDRQGTILYANEGARRALERCDGLQIGADGSLSCLDPNAQLQVRQALEAFRTSAGTAAGNRAALVVVARGSSPYPYILSMRNAIDPAARVVSPTTPFVHVRFKDPMGVTNALQVALRQVYRLTEAETQVVVVLLDGLSTRETARLLGRSPNTVLTQLRHAYAKLGVSKRSELVRICLSLT